VEVVVEVITEVVTEVAVKTAAAFKHVRFIGIYFS
jgi:hypothetical protein